jgi:uncharacterized protein YlxW (UPF0749 family)
MKLTMTRSHFCLSGACLITGFLFALQLLSPTAGLLQNNPVSQRMINLTATISNLEAEIATQQDYIESTRNELSLLESQDNIEKLQLMRQELKEAQIRAGLTSVTGPGVIITVDDNHSGQKTNPDDDPQRYIIHFEHILNIVGELKTAGAEAIAVNGQRLITTSEIRCVGNVILVNTTRIAPPFEIHAVGSPSLMMNMVNYGELDVLRSSNYPVQVAESDALILPAYKGDLQFQYARLGGL